MLQAEGTEDKEADADKEDEANGEHGHVKATK